MQDDVASDSDHTTAILLARIRAGDGVARTNLVARMEPLLRHFAHGRVPQLLRHEQDTADLLQLTWLKVLERIELIYTEGPGDFFAYLRTALINGLRESIRRVGRAPAVELGESNSFEALPAAAVDLTDWLAYEQAHEVVPMGRYPGILRRTSGACQYAAARGAPGHTGSQLCANSGSCHSYATE